MKIEITLHNLEASEVNIYHRDKEIFGYRFDCEEMLCGRLIIKETVLGLAPFIEYHDGSIFPLKAYILYDNIIDATEDKLL